MSDILDRIKQLSENELIKITSLESKIGASKGVLSRAINNKTDIQSKWLIKLVENYPKYSSEWLLTGKGEMMRGTGNIVNEEQEVYNKKSNLIPVFNDVSTIGGASTIANVDPKTHPSEWIDAGDWFPGANAAIRHYGDSMPEYPSGCILALREVNDIQLIFWGKNHCIETSEGRITKKIYDEGEVIMAYSTNKDTYPDGRLIDPPFSIPKNKIKKIYQVLGYVVKEYSNGPVMISNN